MGYINKAYLQTQLENLAARISAVFAKATDIPTKTSQLTNDSGYKTTDNTLTNNLLATVPGTALDAVQGKVLDDKIEAVNASLDDLGGFKPVIDETTGEITGYKTEIGGADTVFPFRSGNTPCMVLTTINSSINLIATFTYFNEEGIPAGVNIYANSDVTYSNKNLFDANIFSFTRIKSSITTTITALQELYYIKIKNTGVDNGTIIEKTKMNIGDTLTISSSDNAYSAFIFTFS